MLPVLFLAHGSPMIAIEQSEYGTFLDHLIERIGRPRAVVVFSAHFESTVQVVSAADRFSTIYDFGGFPDALYQIVYPAPGARTLAAEIGKRLDAKSIPWGAESQRGLDHGAWTLLKRLLPAADVPVVEMSVNQRLAPDEQFRVGQALAGLRDDGVLIVGSGVTVHNFQLLSPQVDPGVVGQVRAFEAWLQERLKAWDVPALFAYASQAPGAQLAVPPRGREHFAPLFYVMGAASEPASVEVLHESWLWNVMTNTAYALH
jgi:4,5-DOPA dioxygenase extradiol